MAFYSPAWTKQPTPAQKINPQFSPIAIVLPGNGTLHSITDGFAEATAERTGAAGVGIIETDSGYGVGSAVANLDVYRLHSVGNQTNTVWERPSAQVSVLAYITLTGPAPGGYASIFSNAVYNVAPYAGWSLVDGSTNSVPGILNFEFAPGGTYKGIASPQSTSIPLNTPTVVVVTYDGAVVKMFFGGWLVTSSAASGALTYPNAANRGPSVCGFWNYPVNTGLVGRMMVGALWDRALTGDEVLALSLNPWRLFAPRRIWVPQAGITGLPTLSLATFTPGSITTNGFRPRVTAT